jgi:hypothetical protein
MTKKLDSFTASQASTSTVPRLLFKRNQLETEIPRVFGHRAFSRQSYIAPMLSNPGKRRPLARVSATRSAPCRARDDDVVPSNRAPPLPLKQQFLHPPVQKLGDKKHVPRGTGHFVNPAELLQPLAGPPQHFPKVCPRASICRYDPGSLTTASSCSSRSTILTWLCQGRACSSASWKKSHM